MNRNDFIELVEGVFQKKCVGILTDKGEDYAGSADTLSSFKEIAEQANVSVEQVFWIFTKKHLRAIDSYVKKGGKVESEPIESRIIDAINYLFLFYGYLVEKGEIDEPGGVLRSTISSPGEEGVTAEDLSEGGNNG